MQSSAKTVQEYLKELPADRRDAINAVRGVILANLPKGYEECMSYGMIGYVVPHSLYPAGYHCDPKLPLPFISLASQKDHISLGHMGMYSDKDLLDWFTAEYPKHSKTKLDMGKACIRFKKPDAIPFELIAQLVEKMTPEA